MGINGQTKSYLSAVIMLLAAALQVRGSGLFSRLYTRMLVLASAPATFVHLFSRVSRVSCP